MMPEILQQQFFQNTVLDYLISVATFLVSIIGIKILNSVILAQVKKWARKTRTELDDSLIQIFESNLVPLLYVGALYISVQNLEINAILVRAIDALGTIAVTFAIAQILISASERAFNLFWLKKGHDPALVSEDIKTIRPAIRVVVWTIATIFLLDNLGFDLSAVITGLGIGGAAIALASRGVLEDLFSYFSILFDRPFEIGDFIIIGDYMGAIEHVGIKSTRIRSLSGEQLVFCNKDLTESRIRNYKRMERRRVVFNLGVTYETSTDKLTEIPGIVRGAIEQLDNTTFDRAHFFSYGDFSLNFEIVYYILSSDYTQYMDAQQKINLTIKEEFEKREIEMAYPTQTLYLNQLPTTA
jgi:small-conductance mechanosensitive channel